MGYPTLLACVTDLEKSKQLVRIDTECDPHLEIGAIQRRVYQAGGPALLFTRVRNCRFPMLGNLFGTINRTHYVFRDTLKAVRALIDLKAQPEEFFKHPFRSLRIPAATLHLRPRKVKTGPILQNVIKIGDLPQLQSWPQDGGAFITLPQVYTESLVDPGFRYSNLGMYRVQISGGQYSPDKEVGLHYQIHRGIGVHHTEAVERRKPLRVNIFVGGAPAMTLAAVMPLPEGMPEISFAGVLAGHRIPMISWPDHLPIYAEADFCITGTIHLHHLLPEGPFGDHLGYYSLSHDYPVLEVEHVYHRDGAIWPFTTVGRPPQEDTSFGTFIHELTGSLIPKVLPGVKAVHAVDAAGVHPLLLAIGSERYTPYQATRVPQEILTQANAILGQGQLSLAKYLWISSCQDNPQLDIHDVPAFFKHMLERVDWTRDLHFQTGTTMDTLDYSGSGLNRGSKVVIAAVGPKRRNLATQIPSDFKLPEGFKNPKVVLPGILVVESPSPLAGEGGRRPGEGEEFPLIIVVDDSEFTARTLNNFLWITFTRSNPAADIDGFGAFIENKHWGCRGPLVIDARRKFHHAPPLEMDPEIERRVDALGAPGGALHKII